MSTQKIIKFEEGWEILKTGIAKLQNSVEELGPKLTPEEHMTLYTTVYNLCTQGQEPYYIAETYEKYKETCEEYIRSRVLPSLREKKDDAFLRELLRRWSIYQVMIKRLSNLFDYLDRRDNSRHGILQFKFPSLVETSCRSFYHLVYEGMNKEIMDALFAMMGRKLAGEIIDQTFVNKMLVFYFRFSRWTKKVDTEKNINLISYDGNVFEVDYGFVLKSKRFEEITKTISHGCTDAIYVPKVSGEMLGMVVEYYNKHKKAKQSELMDWDAQFVDVDPKTLLNLATAACYMKIVGLEELAWSKVGELIKGKTPEEISQIFGAVDDLNSKLSEAD